MSRSIVQEERECWFCGARVSLEEHHIFAGGANRKISEKYGLKVYLCHKHHTGEEGAQYDREKNLQLKRIAQQRFDEIYSHELWMNVIRKNYL